MIGSFSLVSDSTVLSLRSCYDLYLNGSLKSHVLKGGALGGGWIMGVQYYIGVCALIGLA